MLTPESFNALLKTLEEPPKHALFILATTELHKIPATIFSRCQHFAFRKLPLKQIVERLETICRLEHIAVASDVLEEIARRANGAVRDAEVLLAQITATGKKKINSDDAYLFLPKVGFSRIFGWISQLLTNRTDEALRSLQSLEDDGVNLEFFLQESLEFARQLFLYQVTHDAKNLELYFSSDEIVAIKDLLKDVSLTRLRTILVELLRASQDMKLSPDLPILPIELAVVAICSPAVIPSPTAASAGGVRNLVINHKDNPQSTNQPINQSTSESIAKSHNNPINSNSRHTLSDILSGWGDVLARVKSKSEALNFMLSVAQPVAVNNDTVELAFKYRLQQERVSETKNQMIVEQAMSDVFGAKLRLLAKLQEDIKIKGHKGIEGDKGDIKGEKESLALSDEELLTRVAMQVFEGAVVE
jgi:DNA polymerase-3 subunit gamma/tau